MHEYREGKIGLRGLLPTGARPHPWPTVIALRARASRSERQVILSQDGLDVAAIIHIEVFWLLENSIEQLEEDFYAEEAKQRLNDPNEVPIHYEFAKICGYYEL